MGGVVANKVQFANVQVSGVAEAMLSLFACAGLQPDEVVYVSTPITSGELFLSRLEEQRSSQSQISHADLREQVIQENLASVRPFTKAVRDAVAPRSVVEPVSLSDVPEWEQFDYHAFWCAFIERYAHTVVFNDGWHFSNGCAAEFAAAVIKGCQVLDREFRPIPPGVGAEMLDQAADRVRTLGLDVTLLVAAATAVRDHLRGDAGS